MTAYALAADELDLDALSSLFTEDVEVALGDQTHCGREAVLAWYAGTIDPGVFTQHLVGNFSVTLGEEDRMEFACYLRALVVTPQGTRLTAGTYSVTARKVDGSFRIARNKVRIDKVVHLSTT
jgi:hypothetical protein